MKRYDKKMWGTVVVMMAVLVFCFGCKNTEQTTQNTASPGAITAQPVSASAIPKATKEPVQVAVVDDALQIKVDNLQTSQTIRGFGAAFTWYSDFLNNHPAQDEVCDLLFRDAGLSILRFRNTYNQKYSADTELMYYTQAQKRAKERGEDVSVLLSTWSPGQSLKSNNSLMGDGSLKKNADGTFAYADLGNYQKESVEFYESQGVPIDYLSIQNECDFTADYDGCLYRFTESGDVASYSKAYLATYEALKQLKNPPKMIGPETMTASYMEIQSLMKEVFDKAPESVFGIAHHLYSGGGYTDRLSFTKNFNDLRDNYSDVERWQTEFYRGEALDTAQIIHEELTQEDLNAYIYWDGVWDYESGLIGLENGIYEGGFLSDKGYEIHQNYYALRHFSQFIRPGYKRVQTAIPKSKSLLASTYVSPEQDKMVSVLINTSKEDRKIQIHYENYNVTDSISYVSNFSSGYKKKNMFVKSKGMNKQHVITVPAKSIMTVVLEGESGGELSQFTGKVEDSVKDQEVIALKGEPSLKNVDDSAWDKAETQEIIRVANGDHGASASFQTCFDQKNIYVKVKVKDSTKDVKAKNMSDRDGIELYLDQQNSKPETYSASSYHVAIDRKGNCEIVTSKDKIKVSAKVKETKDGYVVVAALPLTRLVGMSGRAVGFDVQVNDSHGNGACNWILKWSDTSQSTDKNLMGIGTLKLF